MLAMWRWLLLLILLAVPAWPATKLLVTVVEQKSGKPVTDLKAADFTVLDDRTPRKVEAAVVRVPAARHHVPARYEPGRAGWCSRWRWT